MPRIIVLTRTALPCATALFTAVALARAVTFSDIAAPSGITNSWDGNPNLYGAGALLEDLDADGDIDAICVNDENRAPAYYENRGDATFIERGLDAGFVDIGNAKGVCAADVDSDGLLDVIFGVYDYTAEGAVVPAYTSSVRYFHNDGGGRFSDRTQDAGLALTRVGAYGVSAADYDRDGWVDLFVCNRGIRAEGGGISQLFRNRGDGTFENVTEAAGFGATRRPSFQGAFTDLDNDGDADLYIATDKLRGNLLYRNNGDGTFTDASVESGAGVAMNGMCVASGDYDNDGAIDLFVTNTPEGHVLLHNAGDGTFTDVSRDVADFTGRVGWGAVWMDCDNDGWNDLYVANYGRGGWGTVRNGALERDQLFLNVEAASFADISLEAACADGANSFGAASGDVDGDGAMDVLITNDHDPPALHRNDGPVRRWLALRLAGVASNAAAIGARVDVYAGARRFVREVQSGASYLSHSSLEVLVGVDAAERADSVCIRWPNGAREVLRDVATNVRYWVVEGHGVAHGAVPLAHALTEAGGVPALAWTAAVEPGTSHWLVDRLRADDEPVRVAEMRLVGRSSEWVDLAALDLPRGTYRYVVSVRDARGDEREVWRSGDWRIERAEWSNDVSVHVGVHDVRVRFTTDAASEIGLRVCDLRGRVIDTHSDATSSAGEYEIRWPMRDTRGRAVPAGVYVFDAWVGDHRERTKAVILPR